MDNVEEKLREEAKKLLTEKKADLIIGYEQGTLPLTATPCFITVPDDAERLIFNALCVQNLAKFITDVLYQHRESQKRLKPEEKTKKVVGVVARGCTSRSVIIHLQEKQYTRDEVVVLGVPCRGYVDQRKMAALAGGREILDGALGEGRLSLKFTDGEKDLALSEVLADNCLTCHFNNPLLHDKMLGEAAPAMDPDGEYKPVEEYAALPEEERWNRFAAEMSKCIRCYACRNVCPSCYCRSCFVEQTQPRWIGIGDDPSDSRMFQLMRMYHMAGRCVDCGSCSAVCPMGVDLRTYLKKIDSDGWRLFGHRAGAALEEPALLGAFREDDWQEFIFEPE